MSISKEQLQNRTKKFEIDVIRFTETLEIGHATRPVINQIIRSATSIGANYRSASRAKSDKDFLNKILIIEEEADETMYWLEIIQDLSPIYAEKATLLHAESKELVAIFTAIGKKMKQRINFK